MALPPQSFRIGLERLGRGAVIAPAGELDVATADRLRSAMELDEAQAEVVVLDLRGLTFMDSSGLALIIGQRRAHERRGARFAVVLGTERTVLRVLQISGLLPALDVVDEPADAV